MENVLHLSCLYTVLQIYLVPFILIFNQFDSEVTKLTIESIINCLD